MAHKRHRDRKPARGKPYREPKPRILIVCEGQITEPQYLVGFKNSCRNPRVDIIIAPEHGVPKTLVQIAKKRKNEAAKAAKRERDDNLKYDSVWAVFDVDEHPNVPDAKQMAHDNGIKLAISNPSFELWLLLHFRDSPGMKHRNDVKVLLVEHIDDYDKHVVFAKYRSGYAEAVARAKQLGQLAIAAGTPGCNPSTGVYELTESIAEDL